MFTFSPVTPMETVFKAYLAQETFCSYMKCQFLQEVILAPKDADAIVGRGPQNHVPGLTIGEAAPMGLGRQLYHD